MIVLAWTWSALDTTSGAETNPGSASSVENEWFRAWPPASASYSFSSELREGETSLGNLSTAVFQGTYIESVGFSDHFRGLLGGQWQRVQSSVPSDVPLPETLQSASAVLGFDWFLSERWRARLEVFPGVYSDFEDVSGDDFNAPFYVEVSYALGPDLLLATQLNVNVRRQAPVLGAVGVRWKFTEDWLLSLWFPRPRIEYSLYPGITLFAGANIIAGTFLVAEEPGPTHDQIELDHETLDFQQVQVGGGLRVALQNKVAMELSAGWTLRQDFDYTHRDIELTTRGAPYVQLGFGLMF